MAEYSRKLSFSNNDPSVSVPIYSQQRAASLYRHRMRPLFPVQRYVLGRQKQQRSYRLRLLKRYAIHLFTFFVLLVLCLIYTLNSASGLEQMIEDMHNSKILAPADVAVNESDTPAANHSAIAVPFDAPIEANADTSLGQEEQIPTGVFVVLESVDETPAQQVPAQAQVPPAQAAPAQAAPAAPAPAAPAQAAPAPAQPAPAQAAPAQPTPVPAAPAQAPSKPHPTSYADYASYYSTGCCIWPVRGRISSRVTRWHMALDIANSYGTPVVAADGGRVIAAGWDNTGYGYRVIIDHGNGISTLYAHFSRYFVDYGDFVSKGQLIGKVGATGWASGPHLHFEVRRNNYRQNPYNWLP